MSFRLPPRHPPREPPGAEPYSVVRSIIEAADGVDRPTVEVLAEEEGVDRPDVDRVLEAMRKEGAVVFERGPDGEEVYAWAQLGPSS